MLLLVLFADDDDDDVDVDDEDDDDVADVLNVLLLRLRLVVSLFIGVLNTIGADKSAATSSSASKWKKNCLLRFARKIIVNRLKFANI